MLDRPILIDGNEFNIVKSGIEQYHLYEIKPLRTGGECTIHKAPYIRMGWKDINTHDFRQVKLNEPDFIKRKLLENREQFKKEVYLEEKFLLNNKAIECYGDHAYVVMEDHGLNLREYLHYRKTDFQERIQIILGLLNEVQLMQKKGIVHCDLKLDNICIKPVIYTQERIYFNKEKQIEEKKIFQRKYFKVRIIDFGYALDTVLDEKSMERTGGSVEYTAPEKIFSFDSDIFSLGPLMTEILGGDHLKILSARKEEKRKLTSTARKEKKEKNEKGKTLTLNCDFEKLPGYDFSSMLEHLSVPFMNNENLKKQFVDLASKTSASDRNARYSIEYLIAFFMQVATANEEIMVAEADKSIFTTMVNALKESIDVDKYINGYNGMVDKAFDYLAPIIPGSGNRKPELIEQARISSTTLIQKTILNKDFHALAKLQLEQSPDGFEASFARLAQYRDKFKGTNSTGIISIFDKMDANIPVEEKIKAISDIGIERSAERGFFGKLFFRDTRPPVLDLYKKFARLKTDEEKLDSLNIIEQELKTKTFV